VKAGISALLLACLMEPWVLAHPDSWEGVRAQARESLCDALARAQPGEQLEVTVAGLFYAGFEDSAFYDPTAWPCEWDVQPASHLEFSSTIPNLSSLNTIIEADGRAYLALRGTLWGPTPARSDDLSLPAVVAFMNRLNGPVGYGMGGWLRTKVVVAEILAVRSVPSTAPSAAAFMLPRPGISSVPTLSSAALPHYPAAARRVGVTGSVVVQVGIIGGQVATVAVVSGDRMLVPSVLENVWSWRFSDEQNATLTSTFSFALELRKTGAGENDRLELDLPLSAKIIGARKSW
jgi:Gram-negative bacterial TonB protein C-terminal